MKDFLSEIASGKINKDRMRTPLHVEYEEPNINKSEILRYAGFPAGALKNKLVTDGKEQSYLEALADRCARCGKGCDMSVKADCCSNIDAPDIDSSLMELLDETLKLSNKELTYRVSYCCMPLEWTEKGDVILPFEANSRDINTNLKGCSGIIVFAATIGAGIDRLIRRYERTQPAKGLLLQGIGAERVEAVCDAFNNEVNIACKELGLIAHPRYSPGYGDLPITVQPEVLKLVDAEKRLGITLNASYLMSPSKSVTAIIGIEKQ